MPAENALTARAGFAVEFDAERGYLATEAPLRFNRVVRTKADIAQVLYDGNDADDSTELYWIFQLADAGPDQHTFDDAEITYACVLLPSRMVGSEFVKTQGHYHPAMPGTRLEYPEVYSHLFGEIYLLLQRRDDGRSDSIDDCVLLDMRRWGSVTIPPGYAHVLINPSKEPAAIAGLYGTAFKPDYHPFVEMGGAAHFLINDNGEQFVPNPRYSRVTPVRRLPARAESQFLSPNGEKPLWSAFLESPERYAFVSKPEAAVRKFGGNDS